MDLHIAGFAEANIAGVRTYQIAVVPPLAEQSLAMSETSTAFNATTRLVRLCADEPCRVAFAAAPTATSTSLLLQAGSTEYFGVPISSGYKINVIAA